MFSNSPAVTSFTRPEPSFNLQSFINQRFSSLFIILFIHRKCSFLPLRLDGCAFFFLMHFASAAATLWCFHSLSVHLYLTFISLSAFASICLPVQALWEGKALRLFICSLLPLPIQYEGESYRLWTGFRTWLDTICYLFPVFTCGSIPSGAR